MKRAILAVLKCTAQGRYVRPRCRAALHPRTPCSFSKRIFHLCFSQPSPGAGHAPGDTWREPPPLSSLAPVQCRHHISKFVTSDLGRPPLCSELSLLPPASCEGCLPWQGLRHAVQPLPAAGLPGDICVWTPAGQSPSARTSWKTHIAGGLSRPGPSPPALRLWCQHPMRLGQGRTKAGLW